MSNASNADSTAGKLRMRKLVAPFALWAGLLGLPFAAQGDTALRYSRQSVIYQQIGRTNPGPEAALWHRAEMSSGERAYVERVAEDGTSDGTASAYASAMRQRVQAMHARSAAIRLGVPNLDQEGVVP